MSLQLTNMKQEMIITKGSRFKSRMVSNLFTDCNLRCVVKVVKSNPEYYFHACLGSFPNIGTSLIQSALTLRLNATYTHWNITLKHFRS